MTDALPIRPATVDDADQLVRLKELTMDGWPIQVDRDADPTWRARAAAEYRRQLAGGDLASFVIDAPEGGRLIGGITASLERGIPGPRGNGISGYLGSMVVEDEYRRRGLGEALMRVALEWLADQGAGNVRLWATESGLPIYRRLGFTEIESPFVHMQLRLEPRG